MLRSAGPSDYGALAQRAARFAAALRGAIAGAGVPVRVPVEGPLVGLYLDEREVTDYASARAALRSGRYPAFFAAMLERGVALAPGPYEVMFPGMAHDDAVLEEVVKAAADAAAELTSRERLSPPRPAPGS